MQAESVCRGGERPILVHEGPGEAAIVVPSRELRQDVLLRRRVLGEGVRKLVESGGGAGQPSRSPARWLFGSQVDGEEGLRLWWWRVFDGCRCQGHMNFVESSWCGVGWRLREVNCVRKPFLVTFRFGPGVCQYHPLAFGLR